MPPPPSGHHNKKFLTLPRMIKAIHEDLISNLVLQVNINPNHVMRKEYASLITCLTYKFV